MGVVQLLTGSCRQAPSAQKKPLQDLEVKRYIPVICEFTLYVIATYMICIYALSQRGERVNRWLSNAHFLMHRPTQYPFIYIAAAAINQGSLYMPFFMWVCETVAL